MWAMQFNRLSEVPVRISCISHTTRDRAATAAFNTRIHEMASLDTVHPMVSGHQVGTRLRSLASHLVDSVVTWNNARITRNQLSNLSDHELADIGISRDQIASIGR